MTTARESKKHDNPRFILSLFAPSLEKLVGEFWAESVGLGA